jgi:hypothetical protein
MPDRWPVPRILMPDLPRRVRARLWLAHQVDSAAIWMVCHEHFTAARVLWKIAGQW